MICTFFCLGESSSLDEEEYCLLIIINGGEMKLFGGFCQSYMVSYHSSPLGSIIVTAYCHCHT